MNRIGKEFEFSLHDVAWDDRFGRFQKDLMDKIHNNNPDGDDSYFPIFNKMGSFLDISKFAMLPIANISFFDIKAENVSKTSYILAPKGTEGIFVFFFKFYKVVNFLSGSIPLLEKFPKTDFSAYKLVILALVGQTGRTAFVPILYHTLDPVAVKDFFFHTRELYGIGRVYKNALI